MDTIAPKVIEALKTVYDPEIPVNIFEMDDLRRARRRHRPRWREDDVDRSSVPGRAVAARRGARQGAQRRNPETPAADLGKLSVLAGVREFPTRIKCASLAWHTMKAAVAHDTDAPVSTNDYLPTMTTGGLPEDSPANAVSESTADITPDPAKMDAIAPKVIEALKTVYDPEIPVKFSRWASSTTCSSMPPDTSA